MEILFGLAFVISLVGWMYLLRRQQTTVQQAIQVALESEQRMRDLQNDLRERDKAIANSQRDMATADGLILNLRQEVARNHSTIADYETQLKQQRDTIATLRNQINTSEKDSVQSKALFETVATVAYDVVFVLDEDFTVIAMNHAADQLFGPRHPLGEPLLGVIDSPYLQDVVERALGEDESLEEQITIDTTIYRARTQVMRYDNEHVFIGVALQDVTKLVRLNRARRDMVSNISHELNTPITKIRLIIEGLFHEQERPKRKASIASLKDIAREVDSLQDIVDDMHYLSRIESGQAIMMLVSVNLVEIVDESIERVSNQLEDRDLRIVKHIPERIRVLCDRDQVRRVMLNLIGNAIKWSPDGETITLSALEGVTSDGETEITISVFDNGPGVPEDQRERIFERFYQIDPARTKGQGSGLGLAICKHVVEAHGGYIWAEGNSKGGGGRFLFTLLAADSEAEDDAEPLPFNAREGTSEFDAIPNVLRNGDTPTPPIYEDVDADDADTDDADDADTEQRDAEQTEEAKM
jgi:two-component system, OmpR family, phosphate regulon sensor histidine kinase PhoR